LKYWILKL